MIMTGNYTCGNDTCSPPTSSTGFAVGLTLFFLLLVIIAGGIVYKFHSKIRNMVQFGQRRRSQKKEDYPETPQADSHEYTSRIREQSGGQTPIYENLTTQTAGYKRPPANQSRSPGEPEEELYVECDLPDDGIYSNDPARNSNLPNNEEEDVYLVPE